MLKIEGLAELDEALKELPKATSRNVLLRTLKEQGKLIADAGESLAPRRTGWLAESYQVSTKLTRRQKTAKGSDVEVYVGPGASSRSIVTEFGSAHQAAHPHLRPAWDSNKKRVLNGIRDSLAKEIEKARARLARKAERLAAKMKAG
jgi:HK97 gp10 family phage protein